MKSRFTVSLSFLFALLLASMSYGQKLAEPFEFQFEGKTLRGLIERPQEVAPSALVIIIPGSGKTNFVEGRWYSRLRDQFIKEGLAVCFWDKMGCGQSEGTFDELQPVDNSAEEAIAAIQELKRREVPGLQKIGLWGLSRAGWICPLIIKQYPIDFWISVSGTDDKENYGYLLKSNLIIAGKEEAEVEILYHAWRESHRLSCTGGTLEETMEAVRPLQLDSTSRRLFGYSEPRPITEADRLEYKARNDIYTSKGHFDEASGLWVYLEDFEETLSAIDCPVLALFGANDSQVDWRKTKALYERTLDSTNTTYQVFENCNHNMHRCITCAYGEDLSALQWQSCDGYYDTMHTWLKEQGIVK